MKVSELSQTVNYNALHFNLWYIFFDRVSTIRPSHQLISFTTLLEHGLSIIALFNNFKGIYISIYKDICLITFKENNKRSEL